MIEEKQLPLSCAHPALSKGFFVSSQPLIIEFQHQVKLRRNHSEQTDLFVVRDPISPQESTHGTLVLQVPICIDPPICMERQKRPPLAQSSDSILHNHESWCEDVEYRLINEFLGSNSNALDYRSDVGSITSINGNTL